MIDLYKSKVISYKHPGTWDNTRPNITTTYCSLLTKGDLLMEERELIR